jgi:hypothetical protein
MKRFYLRLLKASIVIAIQRKIRKTYGRNTLVRCLNYTARKTGVEKHLVYQSVLPLVVQNIPYETIVGKITLGKLLEFSIEALKAKGK